MNWRVSLIAGASLGVAVAVWQIVAAAAGLHGLFPLVATLIELITLVGALVTTRHEQSYAQQVGAGLTATVVSLPIIAAGFVLTVCGLFPEVIPTMLAETRTTLEAAGSAPEEIEAALAAMSATAQGVAGLVGTAITGLLISLVAPIGLRKSG